MSQAPLASSTKRGLATYSVHACTYVRTYRVVPVEFNCVLMHLATPTRGVRLAAPSCGCGFMICVGWWWRSTNLQSDWRHPDPGAGDNSTCTLLPDPSSWKPFFKLKHVTVKLIQHSLSQAPLVPRSYSKSRNNYGKDCCQQHKWIIVLQSSCNIEPLTSLHMREIFLCYLSLHMQALLFLFFITIVQ